MIQHDEWSYGITACSQRLDNGLLDRTILSLTKSGFIDPIIFIDNGVTHCFNQIDDVLSNTSYRSANLKPFGNWILAAWELWIRNPHAQRYAIFQDDVVAVKGLFEYLSTCEYPNNGYMNLFTFPENQKAMSHKLGWYPADGQGLGALGLVFDNEAMSKLLRSPHLVMRCQDPHRGHKLIDGAVNQAMKNEGYTEYVHNPSLLQHAGQFKSTFPEKVNRSHALSPSFPGEDVIINTLMERPQVVAGKRIGFVGRHCGDEISERNLQFCKYVDIDRWMIVVHPTLNIKYPVPDWLDCTACRNGTDRKMEEFARTIDILIFFEDDCRYGNLLRVCKEMGRTVVGVKTNNNANIYHVEYTDHWLTVNEGADRIASIQGLDAVSMNMPVNKFMGARLTDAIRNLATAPIQP